MPLFDSFAISASGMTANRLWLDLITNNIANLNTAGRPGDPSLPPYKRQVPVFSELLQNAFNSVPGKERYKRMGVHVPRVTEDQGEPRLVYEPDHPYADENGYVALPNINVANEMVNMIAATRAYDANVSAFEAAKSMALKALEIGRG
ncbi:MAG: flagellar basal body rod protein FlgC [Peptococcaceae bacterium]|nr:flagellar basal body rod protein FlgC [Peptococcaceae bacterium]